MKKVHRISNDYHTQRAQRTHAERIRLLQHKQNAGDKCECCNHVHVQRIALLLIRNIEVAVLAFFYFAQVAQGEGQQQTADDEH